MDKTSASSSQIPQKTLDGDRESPVMREGGGGHPVGHGGTRDVMVGHEASRWDGVGRRWILFRRRTLKVVMCHDGML